MGPRRTLSITSAALLSTLTTLMPVVPVNAAPSAPYEKAWETTLAGWNRSSSPVVADIDSDGRNEIVVGHQDGKLRAYEGDGSLKWATPAVPGINRRAGCRPQTTPTAIDSSPAVADIDGDGKVEVVVGVGSTFASNQNGSVISFDGATGAIEWAFDRSRDTGNLWHGTTPVKDGWCEGTYATPAIGDVDGDGGLDVVFGSWDFYIWAVDGQGVPLPGFPVNNDDTVWSSPALFDADGDGDMEIFVGGDSTPGGFVDHLGGVFWAIDHRDGAAKVLWRRFASEVYHSSAAIGDINGDGRFEAVVGMGHNWWIECTERKNPQCTSWRRGDQSKVWAYHLDDGTDVPGWPVQATDTTDTKWGSAVWASPAIGDIDADGQPEVVVGSYDHNVYAWNGDGRLLWRVKPEFPVLGTGRVTAPAVIADLDGDSDQDVAVGTDWGLALLDGRDGSSFEFRLAGHVSFPYSHETAAAVGTINGSRHIVVTGFDTPHSLTRLAAYRLPPTSAEDAWPMFRHSAARVGAASTAPARQVFPDVPRGRYYSQSVADLAAAGVFEGTECDGGFCPGEPIDRKTMAVWMVRVVDGADPATVERSRFDDVDVGGFYARFIERMAELEVTTGCGDGIFCPDRVVTRAQMAVFLTRAFSLAEGPDPGFSDVPSDAWYAHELAALAASGITKGCETGFCPGQSTTRAQMATFLHRARNAYPLS